MLNIKCIQCKIKLYEIVQDILMVTPSWIDITVIYQQIHPVSEVMRLYIESAVINRHRSYFH
jgi:hypothetical protein